MTEVGDSAQTQALFGPGADLRELQEKLRQFAQERDWHKFHRPRNLMLALVGEIGELSAIFQWLSDERADAVMSDADRALQVREELADIFAYLLQLADVLGVDLRKALEEKIKLNAKRYPADRVRGKALKYTDLSDHPPAQPG